MIAFSVSTNAKLQEELVRLKIITEGLCNTSRILFRLRQGHEIDKNPTPNELQLLDKGRALSRGLSELANDLFLLHKQSGMGQEWDLAKGSSQVYPCIVCTDRNTTYVRTMHESAPYALRQFHIPTHLCLSASSTVFSNPISQDDS
jgi:hypothetical protein